MITMRIVVIQASIAAAVAVREVHALKIIADLYSPPASFMHQIRSLPWSSMPAKCSQ